MHHLSQTSILIEERVPNRNLINCAELISYKMANNWKYIVLMQYWLKE